MSERINIDTARVSACCAKIRSCNAQLDACLKEIERNMAGLQANWQSDAGEAIRNNFQASANRYFLEYKEHVERYAKFLDQTVETYTATETNIKSNASAFS